MYVRSSDRAAPNDGGAKIWFEGAIGLDTALLLDAALAREPRLRPTTCVRVFEDLQGSRGAMIQQLGFKTDWLQPLNEGNNGVVSS